MPTSARPQGLPVMSWRSSIGATSGRSARQSRAVTRCTVERIRTMRTAWRVSSSSARSSVAKPREARPEPVVGRVRRLRLHADEVLERVGHRHRQPLEQPLACEQRPVERARAEQLRHGPSIGSQARLNLVRPAADVRAMTTVTCVILSHDHREFAVQAVESALRQEYPAELLDVVILDDGSRDGTGDLLEQTFGDNPRVTVLRQENQGFVRSTNRVVAAATGELIGFLDGDDMWVRDRVRRQVALLDARPDVGLVHGDMQIVDAHGTTLHPSFFAYSGFGEVPRGPHPRNAACA